MGHSRPSIGPGTSGCMRAVWRSQPALPTRPPAITLARSPHRPPQRPAGQGDPEQVDEVRLDRSSVRHTPRPATASPALGNQEAGDPGEDERPDLSGLEDEQRWQKRQGSSQADPPPVSRSAVERHNRSAEPTTSTNETTSQSSWPACRQQADGHRQGERPRRVPHHHRLVGVRPASRSSGNRKVPSYGLRPVRSAGRRPSIRRNRPGGESTGRTGTWTQPDHGRRRRPERCPARATTNANRAIA